MAGMTTAPILKAASMISQSATSLPSISRMRSPRCTPSWRRWLATRLERLDRSRKL
ncbi:hypothetical protein D9M71_764670 [compost metagenome]